ncbi:MAG: hypothetical protein COT85_01165 [Chlamydiae bacterium CG10_big_fil_rev_8_21_14_0_10_42_34]|nr:MAG: hypothetical protein COT85_01165 [Chlamydiae bacterium CG10_big_fil_rev_8_21_14_0_10_42_34]
MRICPIDRQWIHTFLLEPYLQGCEMVNRAWKGIDFHSLVQRPFSLKERIVFWFTGSALMIPLINSVIWISWQTLGAPEILFDPFCPDSGYFEDGRRDWPK